MGMYLSIPAPMGRRASGAEEVGLPRGLTIMGLPGERFWRLLQLSITAAAILSLAGNQFHEILRLRLERLGRFLMSLVADRSIRRHSHPSNG